MRKNLTTNEIRIYKFCKENADEIYNLKIHELADKAYTTASSISKLVKKMNFNSFQEFKIHVRDALTVNQNSQRCDMFVNGYLSEVSLAMNNMSEQMIRDFNYNLAQCNKIVTHGYGTSDSVAEYIKNNLLVMGFDVYHESSFTTCNVRAKFLTENDCFVLVSNSGESEMMDEIIESAKRSHCKVALITSRANSTLAKKADFLLVHNNGMIEGSMFENISFSIQIAIVDFLLFYLAKDRNIFLKFNSKEED